MLSVIVLSCEEMLDVSFSSSSEIRLVVDGVITTDTTAHQVILSWTGDYFKRDPQNMETGADVSITDGDKTFILTEDIDEPGIYRTDSNVYGETGKSYTLNISLNDGTEYSATELLVERNLCSILPNNDLLDCGDDDNLLFTKDINMVTNILIEYNPDTKQVVVS